MLKRDEIIAALEFVNKKALAEELRLSYYAVRVSLDPHHTKPNYHALEKMSDYIISKRG